MKICFLASGNGGNLKFLYLAQELGILQNIELSVIADRECGSIEFAKLNNINYKVIQYKIDDNQALKDELSNIKPDLIITNWHKIIDEEIVSKYFGKMINLHYSLLPSFGGLIGIAPIEEAYKSGCQYVGATCHYIDNGVDTGKIISQTIVKTDINIEDTINQVFKNACLILLNSIVLLSKEQNLILLKDNEKFNFSPLLQFDDMVFSESFWEKVSIL